MSLADHDSPDVRHLWAAVCAQPDEDTPRLVLADCLEECGDPDRAAFIRAQCAPWMCACITRDEMQYRCPECVGRALAAVSLRRHEADWRRAGKCPACGGTRTVVTPVLGNPLFATMTVRCPACEGTGDRGGLCEPQDGVGAHPDRFHYRVDFVRGFPAAVHAPLQDVFTRVDWPNNAGGWVPTPRALAWVREWPVERVYIAEGARPLQLDNSPERDRWFWAWRDLPGPIAEQAREFIEGDLGRGYRSPFTATFPTEAEAVDALARAVARVLRAALTG